MRPLPKSWEQLNENGTVFETLSSSVQESVKKIIKKENFTQYNVEVENLSTSGDNFLGTLYLIDIKGRTSECEKEVNLFVKEKLIWKNITLFNLKQLYASEEFIYKDLSKVMIFLQNQADIPPEDQFKVAEGYDETSNDVIILENVCKKGFQRSEKNEVASLKFYQLGVQELAKFHALSFVIENKMPEYFKEKIETLETPFHFNDDFFQLMQRVCGYLANLYVDETKTKIQDLFPFLKDNLQNIQGDKTGICTLSHGDYRKCNCMLRMKDGELEALIMIDYQLLDFGCPMRDLLIFLIGGTDQEFRREHFENLKNLYFETISRFLEYFEMDVETVFPRKVFEKMSKDWMKHTLIMFIYFSVFTTSSDEGLDMQNLTLKELPFHPDKDQEKMICGVIDDCVKLGYL